MSMQSDGHPRSKRRVDSILSAGSVYVGTESICYTGSGVAEAGSAVLFLHEAGGNGRTWEGQLTGLAQKARCLVPDLPGHGQSSGTGFQTVAEYRRAMTGFLDALAIRWPVVIAGVCLGAAIAIDLALAAPERVAGLVLAGIKEGGRIDRASFRQAALSESGGVTDALFSESASERLKSDQMRRWNSTSPTVRYGDLVAVSRYPLKEQLSRLSHRVLMVTGERDRSLSPDGAAQLVRVVARGESLMLPGAGCLSMLEQPERFSQAVGRFLEEVRPTVPVMPKVAHGNGYRRSPLPLR